MVLLMCIIRVTAKVLYKNFTVCADTSRVSGFVIVSKAFKNIYEMWSGMAPLHCIKSGAKGLSKKVTSLKDVFKSTLQTTF